MANRLKMDGQMQDTHKCKERAKMAADIIAERYGWVKAEERDTAIFFAVKSIRELVKTPFRTEFYPLDLEDFLPEGIVTKAIDMGREPGSSFNEDNLKAACKRKPCKLA